MLDHPDLEALAKISRHKSFKAHSVIFRDGDESNQYFNINSGIVKLVKTLADGQQHIVGLLYPLDFLGRSLNARHTYAAEAATDVELCVYARASFEAFLKAHPDVERKIYELTLRELDTCRDWTLLLGRKCSYERVAGFLSMIINRMPETECGETHPNRAHFQLPFTRAEMADYLGLTLETVSRQFSRLKQEKIIELPSSRDIVVPNIGLLAAAANIETCSVAIENGQGKVSV